ncbi:MAG TPA: 2-C-methyl-D-erythritol 4-phosphate cytidylyltransferase [Burkholderiaceae bacterium]|nr:2-C-methyl-D-erythritol 4-phosphate cytidylyltransferase [Burkholderiaceae bacterium]
MTRKIIAIVPAAGVGERARAADSASAVDLAQDSAPPGGGGKASPRPIGTVLPKQYGLLRGEPMLRWAVRALLVDDRVTEVRVVVAPGDGRAADALAGLPRTVLRSCGGSTRAATVQAALEELTLDDDMWVLVHDAARPGLPAEDLRRLIDTCLAHGGGGLLARRVADTVKQQAASTPEGNLIPDSHSARAARNPGKVLSSSPRADCDRVARTVRREGLWLAQTPQMFPAQALLCAVRDARGAVDVTDEASAMEHAGQAPLLIPGSQRNFKVTWPEDFALMEKWLEP